MLLASQFQGFCRDLHTECANHVLLSVVCSAATRRLIRAEFTRNRRLDRGNAYPASLAEDFGHFGMTNFWTEVENVDARSKAWKDDLEKLNHWRNAIVHQDFDPAKLGAFTEGRDYAYHTGRLRARRWTNRAIQRLGARQDLLDERE